MTHHHFLGPKFDQDLTRVLRPHTGALTPDEKRKIRGDQKVAQMIAMIISVKNNPKEKFFVDGKVEKNFKNFFWPKWPLKIGESRFFYKYF